MQPQLILGLELRHRGHDVVFATCPNFESTIRGHGFEFIAVGRDSNAVIRENASIAERNPLLALPAQLELITRETEQQCQDLLRARSPHFDLVIGAGLSYAAHLLAERQGATYAFVCYTLAGLESSQYAPATVPVFGLPRVVNRGLWALVRTLFRASVGRVLTRVRASNGLPPRDPWYSIHFTNVILAQDAIMGELPTDVPGNIVHVPALSPSPGLMDRTSALPPDVEAFLQRKPDERLVYVGFGSMPSTRRAALIESVKTLCQRGPVRVLLYSGHDEDRHFELPNTVHVVSALDHTRLFPRVDLVVHHGGAGTTATALRAGVPQLIVPHIVDQFFHARRIEQLGVGARVTKRELDAHFRQLAWSKLGQQHERARALARTLAPSGATQAALQLERWVETGA